MDDEHRQNIAKTLGAQVLLLRFLKIKMFILLFYMQRLIIMPFKHLKFTILNDSAKRGWMWTDCGDVNFSTFNHSFPQIDNAGGIPLHHVVQECFEGLR